MSDVSVSAMIAAPPEAVWRLVSDLPRMGEWSPENTGGRWLRGADGPAVGARFRGRNRHGVLRWSTTCTVVEADAGKRFAFDVTSGPVPVSRWEYTFSATGGGTEVTEQWTDRRPLWLKIGGAVAMAVPDRAKHNRTTMEATLAALKVAAESAG